MPSDEATFNITIKPIKDIVTLCNSIIGTKVTATTTVNSVTYGLDGTTVSITPTTFTNSACTDSSNSDISLIPI
jgi:hypothetical protein